MPSLTLVVSNAFARNPRRLAYKRSITRTRPKVIAVQEAQRLGRIRGYRRHGGRGRLRGGVAIYTRRQGTTVERTWWRLLTDRGAGRYVHPRGVRVVRLLVEGVRVAVICVHANPGKRGDGRRENTRLIAELLGIARRLHRQGYAVVLAGDWNRRATHAGPDSPVWLAGRLGWAIRLHGIDGIVHSLPTTVTGWDTWRPPGADHDAIRVRLDVVPTAPQRPPVRPAIRTRTA